jgi:hypothetical protein
MKMVDEDEMIITVFKWFIQESDVVRQQFLETRFADLVVYHNSLGRKIRNHFELWSNKWEPELEIRNGIECDVSPNHPDAVSMRVIEKFWMVAQEQYANEEMGE